MKKIFAFFFLFSLVSCSDENSKKNPIEPNEEVSMPSSMEDSSSSVKLGKSSSSTKKSSFSAKPEESSSSTKVNSSSAKSVVSSSSMKVNSSSAKPEESSSSTKVNSSSVKPDESSSSLLPENKSSSSEKNDEYSSSEDRSSSESKSSSSEESSSSVEQNSSSSLESTGICKTPTEDNCVYGSLYDERDGKTYKTVKIGEQEWMAENLSYAYNEEYDYSGSFYSRCYNGDSSNCEKYGRLYQWGMAIDSIKLLDSLGMRCGFKRIGCNLPEKWRGLCPKGSHLPSKKEWENLIAFVGEQSGVSLKSINGWVNSSNVAGTVENGNGMDYYGFSVLPSGTMQTFQYYNMNERALFWTASDDSEKNAHGVKFSYASDLAITSYITSKQDANSVRCIRD